MNKQEEQIRNLLISYNVFQEFNDYLLKYIKLICTNIGTPQVKGVTHKHHIIPVAYYSKALPEATKWNRSAQERVARLDTKNFCVNLSVADHIRAHCYMALASKECWFTLLNVAGIELLIGRTVRDPIEILSSLQDTDIPKNKRCWIHRGTESKNISINQLSKYLEAGWALGSKNRHHQVSQGDKEKAIWMHLGAEKKVVSVDAILQYLKLGWDFGMGISTKRKNYYVNKDLVNIKVSKEHLITYLEQGYSYGKIKAGK